MPEDTMVDEVLLQLRDVGLGEAGHADVDASCRRALEREINRERRAPRRRVGGRVPLRVVLPIAALLTAGVGAAGYAALSSPEKLSAGIECHEDASLHGSGAIVGVDGRSATATCAALWADGTLGRNARAAPAPLHACVDPDGGGAIHVFASADAGICERVGLAESPSAGGDAEARRYARFSEALLAKLGKNSCPNPREARQMVQASLDDAGLTGWTVKDTGGYTTELPCASLALDSDARVATISPVGR
jgi:hypothetical protein